MIEERGGGLRKCTTTKTVAVALLVQDKPTQPTVNGSWLSAIVVVFLWSGAEGGRFGFRLVFNTLTQLP